MLKLIFISLSGNCYAFALYMHSLLDILPFTFWMEETRHCRSTRLYTTLPTCPQHMLAALLAQPKRPVTLLINAFRTHSSAKNIDLVLMWSPSRHIGLAEKLLPKNSGPYRVLRQVTDVTYI
uniref:Putative tick transposon n=1 Tax=Rhipicephalus microplus TaxID=6941 RepID=A0A6M2D9B0_RHIMP